MSSTSYIDQWQASGDRKEAPAVARNKEPISDALTHRLKPHGMALEIASGTGEHVCHFASLFREWSWQPSEPMDGLRKSVSAWVDHCGLKNVEQPLDLNLLDQNWDTDLKQEFDLIFNANMVHISPWEVSENLFSGAGRVLVPGGQLCLYGPFFENEINAADSNLRFDASLKSREPSWGIRSREKLEELAVNAGLELKDRIEMPSNNLMLWFEKKHNG
ncbi:class I SAM-dependent methyltransferase [Alphaproteobacteria bacterium]|jgi:SAM-dependent methyltransferase|nr:class I SAM-dependent methyltransferase [Alphaproteobacteria bacterium]